ncbi:hypothetical protein L202_07050 [Cryptococcus amylolentus CBS 6039]|uniref:GH16 domain-containing protein n=1 Tax=Cryptococcus amylolentus CBS 6039 TaxID=1295533 RepID=A0A1E3HH24_9TREE|nr:hypothetical protein L202_07050 [Cryptococcus amylolentus CBS 6039]ODN74721.1 hypothetical protein L202_07050 [Cryptococcus amylolentus CBS 6039]
MLSTTTLFILLAVSSRAVPQGWHPSHSHSHTPTPSTSISSTTTTASTTSSYTPPAPSQTYPVLNLAGPPENCTCGYAVQSLGGPYYPFRYTFTPSSLDDGTMTSPDDLLQYGLKINDGKHAGGEGEDGAQCWGRYQNVRIEGDDLVLTVPGGQTLGPDMDCAEVTHNVSTFGGVYQAEAKLSDVAGTCEAFWLNHTIADTFADEVDIEILTGKLESDGIYYTNWPPFGNPNDPSSLISNYTQTVPFPGLDTRSPTSTYNNYTIVWQADRLGQNGTLRYYNGEAQEDPRTNLPAHAMDYNINAWSNGAPGWSAGPPTADSELRVKSILLYYQTETVKSIGDISAECSSSDVCKI